MLRIAIVGMGTSGTAVLDAYAKYCSPQDISIDCYDKEESFGRGYPYRKDSDHLIVNLKTPKISYDFTDNPDFGRWFEERGQAAPEYASRQAFGEYMCQRLEKSLAKIQGNRYFQEVSRLDRQADVWQLTTQDGTTRTYDRVHLCVGELPQKSLYGLTGKGFYQDIYPVAEKLQDISKEDRVLVLGSGLTGVDVTSYLLLEKDINKIAMASRSNRIPSVRVPPVPFEAKVFTMEKLDNILKEGHGRISFETFHDLFDQELKAQGIDYEAFIAKHNAPGIEGLIYNLEQPHDLAMVQAILPPMNQIFNKVFDAMSQADRQKFRAKYHPFMCLNRSPLPQPTAEILIKAWQAGRLTMPSGLRTVESRTEGGFVLHSNQGEEIFDKVINATGLDISLAGLRQNPLLDQMFNDRYLLVDDYGGLANIPETCQVISPRYGTLENLFTHGVLASGVQYRNNSTLIIQYTAQKLVQDLHGKKA